MHIALLLFQFSVAGIVAKVNPLKALVTMLPAYMTALGTQSSAATIPVTLDRAIKNGVDEKLAGFVCLFVQQYIYREAY
jgi:Na+/H+-dicarboxylate symporters